MSCAGSAAAGLVLLGVSDAGWEQDLRPPDGTSCTVQQLLVHAFAAAPRALLLARDNSWSGAVATCQAGGLVNMHRPGFVCHCSNNQHVWQAPAACTGQWCLLLDNFGGPALAGQRAQPPSGGRCAMRGCLVTTHFTYLYLNAEIHVQKERSTQIVTRDHRRLTASGSSTSQSAGL